ncbi:tRNA (cytidine(32)-2'-O)-methyltransferase non-catalytic subunit TRM732 [Lachnellula arida]|uniref:tRNA (Cytidine(32)-2'-O)-methyltransferase non-catalytic subunit TRM732 n=1 Tax=Lachnellula arida TaxID=1316785 RepID=A0A8T9B776_9HELO|nr:tRNA (cytidine(32)-2'-O)-methyltransferase non-catalytic subunit TRM732 [Lachnellula arida]
MLRRWWIGTKEAISSQASTTRRSAGIPALITGIMTANAPSPNFEEIMADLKLQAQSPIIAASTEQNLPQVHALNGLKDTFKNAAVRKRAEGHVLECVHIASDALNSETWAIRNCGLLLFQALINYLVGTHSKEKTEAGWDGGATAISYDKYPSLGELLLQLLETASDNDSKEASSNALIETIFPVLDILRRAGPPEELRERIVARLFRIIGHKVWQIRELSAKTLCVLVPSEEWASTVQKLIKSCGESTTDSPGENQKHGALLGAKLLLERHLPDCDLSSELQVITPTLELCFSLKQKSVCSTFGSAAYIDLQNTILDVLIPTSNPTIDTKGKIGDLLDNSFPSNTYLHLTNLLNECSSSVNADSSMIGRASIAAFKQAVYLSAFQQDVKVLEEIVELATNSYGIATLISTLDCISEVWMPAQSEDILQKLATIYINVMKASASAKAPAVRAAALNGLCLMLDSAKDLQSTPFRTAVMELDHVLAIATVAKLPTNPGLCAAVDTMIGISVLSEVLSCKPLHENTRRRVEDWGRYMQMNTRDDNDFDTRFAAVRSLQSFFRSDDTESILGDDCLLKALLALHTTLSDDDEEIRELGASTVASLTRNLSTPLQAVQDLAAWMVGKYSSSVSFAHIVVEKMTGADACKRIKASLDPNDSLFAEEDTNLFVDEVRDARLWAKTFHGLSKEAVEDSNIKESPATTLVNWVTAGLTALDTLLEGEDGPLGNTSRPGTYYPCLQVLICQNALIQYMTTHHQGPNSSVDLISGRELADSNLLNQFIANAGRRRIHEDLIFELLSPDSLQKSRLERLYPSIVNMPRDRLTFSLRPRRARLDLPSPPPGEKNHHSNGEN